MSNCIFCEIAQGTGHAWKVHETAGAFAFLDINPVSPYHTLVIPKRHARDMFDVSEKDLLDVMSTLKYVVDLYADKLGLNNLQIVSSSGAEAQQDVFHLHYHIVPRRRGDGQNIRWKTYPETRNQFDSMLGRLT